MNYIFTIQNIISYINSYAISNKHDIVTLTIISKTFYTSTHNTQIYAKIHFESIKMYNQVTKLYKNILYLSFPIPHGFLDAIDTQKIYGLTFYAGFKQLEFPIVSKCINLKQLDFGLDSYLTDLTEFSKLENLTHLNFGKYS